MPALFIYLIKVNIALLIFCLGYYAVLRHLTFYTLNRVYLVTAIVFSALYPFINLSAFINRHQEIARPIQVMVVNWQEPAHMLVRSVSRHDQWYWLQLIFWAGVLVFTIRLATQLLSLYRLHKRSEPMQIRHYMIRVIKGDINPFSFWQSIYINPDNHPPHELDAILEHEQIHVNDWHTLDILLGEISAIFYWFNPGIWLMKRAIRENIEFITDRKILQKGIDCKVYQYSLINVNFGAQNNAIVNHFNISTIKKRIMMMNAKKSSSFNLTRYMFLVPTVVAMLLIFSVSKAELNKAANNGAHLFNKALKTVTDKFSISAKHENKKANVLKAVNLTDILSTDSISTPQTLAGLTFAGNDTNKLNLGNAFWGVPIFIDGEKSTRDDLTHLDANQIAKFTLYTDIPKNDHDDDVKYNLFVITKKNENSEKVNAFLNEFRKNDSTALAHNYKITPVSKTSSNLNMSDVVYPASVMNSIYIKTGSPKRVTQPEVIKFYDSALVFNNGKFQKMGIKEAMAFNANKAKAAKLDSTSAKVFDLAFSVKPDPNLSTSITKVRLNGATYTKGKADTILHGQIINDLSNRSARSTKITKTLRNGVYTVDTTYTSKAMTNDRLSSDHASSRSTQTGKVRFSGTYTMGKADTVKEDRTVDKILTKIDPATLKNATKMRINGVNVDKTKVDSLRKTMEGWEVDKNGAVTKSGQPQYFMGSPFGASPIDLKDKLIIIDGKEATEKQLKKLSAAQIGSIGNMSRDTALAKYGKKAVNGVITITTKK